MNHKVPENPCHSVANSWENLDTLARAAAVATLVAAGFKNREIAHELTAAGLKIDEGTIRRYLRIDRLPENLKERIRDGESVSSVLDVAIEPEENASKTAPAGPSFQTLKSRRDHHSEWIESVYQGMQTDMEERKKIDELGAEALRIHPVNKSGN